MDLHRSFFLLQKLTSDSLAFAFEPPPALDCHCHSFDMQKFTANFSHSDQRLNFRGCVVLSFDFAVEVDDSTDDCMKFSVNDEGLDGSLNDTSGVVTDLSFIFDFLDDSARCDELLGEDLLTPPALDGDCCCLDVNKLSSDFFHDSNTPKPPLNAHDRLFFLLDIPTH